jgi:hypothetical protein
VVLLLFLEIQKDFCILDVFIKDINPNNFKKMKNKKREKNHFLKEKRKKLIL